MELLNKLRKKDTAALLKTAAVKSFIKENSALRDRYHLHVPIKCDEDFFYFECLIQTLKNKEVFEGTFVRTYDDMTDYWQTLNYEERKHLINVEIEKAIADLPYVEKEGKQFYLPCFNDKINAIYKDEMVLFELKQYHQLRFECAHLIDKETFDLDMVKAHFCSLEYIVGDDDEYWCYCHIHHLMMKMKNNRIADYLPIVQFSQPASELKELCHLLEKNDEKETAAYLITHNFISPKMKQKMEKALGRGK